MCFFAFVKSSRIMLSSYRSAKILRHVLVVGEERVEAGRNSL